MADVSPGGTPDQSASPQAVPLPAPAGSVPAGSVPAFPPPQPVETFPAAAETTAPFDPAPRESVGSFQAGAFEQQPAAPLPDGVTAEVPVLPVPGRPTGWRRWLPLFGVVGFLLAAAIYMLFRLGSDIGVAGLAVGLVAAVVPVPLLVASFLWLDRYEPEPIRYLAFCFAWGAAIATLAALLVNTKTAELFDRIGLPDALVAVLVAPFIEETMKALGPILLVWRRRGEWSGITDGIVYCGLSALGFAMVENVLYLGGHGYAAGVEEYGPATGLTNLFLIFILRILFTGFAHPLFTAMTGIGLGISARSGDRRVRWLAPIAGLLLAMILHGMFNLLPTLSVNLSQPLIMLYGYLGFMVPFFFAVVGFAIALRSWEGRLTERILPLYVRAGWFAPPEVAALGSLGRRHSAREWARRVAGAHGHKAMRNFQFAATRLALLRDGIQRGLHAEPVEALRSTAEERELLTAIQEYRGAFTARDPQSPRAFWDGLNYQLTFPDGTTRAVSPPQEPVVPVPVRLAPAAPPPLYAQSPYGSAPYGAHPYSTAAYSVPTRAAPHYGGPTQPTWPYGPPAQTPQTYPPQGYAQSYAQPTYAYPTYAEQPTYAQPTYGQAQPTYGQAQPAYGHPGSTQPAHGYPGSAQPAYGQPGSAQSAYGQPGSAQSAYGQPGSAQPAYGQPGSAQPSYGQPTYAEPTYGQPDYIQPQPHEPAPPPSYGATQAHTRSSGDYGSPELTSPYSPDAHPSPTPPSASPPPVPDPQDPPHQG